MADITTRGSTRIRPPFVEYSEDVACRICDGLFNGQSLRTICKQKGMPTRQNVYRWLVNHPDFAKDFAQAKEDQADAFAEEIVEIADAPVPTDENGRLDSGAVQKQRLRVDARKWIASKLKPKAYGDKLDVAHSGNVSITRIRFDPEHVIEGKLSTGNQPVEDVELLK